MALHTLSISTDFDPEFGGHSTTVYPNTSSGNPDDLNGGDTLRVKWDSHFGGFKPANIKITLINPSHFTDEPSSTFYIYTEGSYVDLTCSGVSGESHIGITPEGAYPSRGYYYNLVGTPDTTPDQFSLGADITGTSPGKYLATRSFTVTGINTTATASISTTVTGGTGRGALPTFNVNGGMYSTANKSVQNGDTVYVKFNTPRDYAESHTTTLTIGGTSDTIKVSAPTQIDAADRVTYSASKASLDAVGSLFGAIQNGKYSANLLRRGGLVPNTTGNAHITATNTNGNKVYLSEFKNCETSFYFISGLANIYDIIDTGFINYRIDLNQDYIIGYCDFTDQDLEISYSLTKTGGSGTFILTQKAGGSTGTYKRNNGYLDIRAEPSGLNDVISGTLTVSLRIAGSPSKVISDSCSIVVEREPNTGTN